VKTATKSFQKGAGVRPELLVPEIDYITRRDFLVGGAAALLLGGCGSGGGGDESSGSGETRTFRDALGEKEIPVSPQRIVTMDGYFTLQAAVEFGAPVVGSMIANTTGFPWPAVLTEEETEDIEAVGEGSEPNLESIAALDPDLIIGSFHGEEPWHEQAARIAPTVLIAGPENGWKEYLLNVADACGVTQRAEEVFSSYDERVSDISSRLRDVTLSHLVLASGYYTTYVQGPKAYAPFAILEEVGVRRPPFEVVENDEMAKDLSLETISRIEGDVMFLNLWSTTEDTEAEERQYEELQRNPLWQRLPAVRNGEVYRVDPGHWMNFGAMRSANLVLDDIEEYLTR
jgi:iron complex transport system substrate-binding protein